MCVNAGFFLSYHRIFPNILKSFVDFTLAEVSRRTETSRRYTLRREVSSRTVSEHYSKAVKS